MCKKTTFVLLVSLGTVNTSFVFGLFGRSIGRSNRIHSYTEPIRVEPTSQSTPRYNRYDPNAEKYAKEIGETSIILNLTGPDSSGGYNATINAVDGTLHHQIYFNEKSKIAKLLKGSVISIKKLYPVETYGSIYTKFADELEHDQASWWSRFF